MCSLTTTLLLRYVYYFLLVVAEVYIVQHFSISGVYFISTVVSVVIHTSTCIKKFYICVWIIEIKGASAATLVNV